MKVLIFIGCVLLLLACKKPDASPPALIFNNSFSSSFNYLEEITFDITATDNKNLESIRVAIFNASNQQVLEPIAVFPNSTSFQFSDAISINDIHLESGDFYIQAKASDGENETIILKSFHINGAPRELIQTLGIVQNTSNNILFYQLQNTNWNFLYNAPIEVFHVQADAYSQRILVAGNTSDGIVSLRLDDGAIVGSSAAPYPLANFLWNDSFWHSNSRTLWMACKDGSVRAYNSSAQIVNQFLAIGNDIPKEIAVTDDRVIVYTANLSGTQHRLDVYQKSSGSIVHSISLEHPIEQMEVLSNDEIWIYQENAFYKQNVYRVQGNYIDEWTNFRFTPSQNLNVSLISDGKLFLNYTDAIRMYNLNGNPLSAGNSYDASQLAHEILSDQLFVVSTNEISVLNGSTLFEINTLPQSDAVIFRYNK